MTRIAFLLIPIFCLSCSKQSALKLSQQTLQLEHEHKSPYIKKIEWLNPESPNSSIQLSGYGDLNCFELNSLSAVLTKDSIVIIPKLVRKDFNINCIEKLQSFTKNISLSNLDLSNIKQIKTLGYLGWFNHKIELQKPSQGAIVPPEET